ncbi:hypothetical protein ACVXKL_28915, partial [Klebsiella pneumoniae]
LLVFAFWLFVINFVRLRTQSSLPISTWEFDPASNQFPKCSPQPGIHKEIHRVGREEKGEGGDRGDLVENTLGTDYWLDLSLSF